MALPIGHRSGVPIPLGHRSGVNKITRRHGIPFYSPADIYANRDFMLPDYIQIRFTTRGRLSGGMEEKYFVDSETLFRFLLSASLADKALPVSKLIEIETNIMFFVLGTVKPFKRLYGETWIIFDSNTKQNRLTGECDIVFSNSGTVNSEILISQALITFVVIGRLAASGTSVFYTGNGAYYNWYALKGIKE